MVNVKFNLMNIYMDYKISRLVKYGLVILNSDDEYLAFLLKAYIETYIKTYYYHQFETVDSDTYSLEVLGEELEGKRWELLDIISGDELVDSNEVYDKKKQLIDDVIDVVYYLINLDKVVINEKDDVNRELNKMLDDDEALKERLGSRVTKLGVLMRETFSQTKDLREDITSFQLDYQLYRDKTDIVRVVLNYNISNLKDNYKKSLVERCYREEKLAVDKFTLLLKAFIKRLIADIYYDKNIYDRYVIEIPEEILEDKKDLEKIIELVNNPLVKRFLVFGVSNDNYNKCKNLLRTNKFMVACMQDFKYINEIDNKLTNLDNGDYDYIVALDYKDKDMPIFKKATYVNVKELLFNKEA